MYKKYRIYYYQINSVKSEIPELYNYLIQFISSSMKNTEKKMSRSENISETNNSINEEFYSERIRDEAIIQLKTVNGRTAADIGAGTGFISEGLLNAGLKVIALDSCMTMIEIMREKFAGIKEFQTLLTDAGSIKLNDDSVDYAFANMYLHHAENPQSVIKEMIRILKPGGKAAVTDLMVHAHEDIQKKHHDRWTGFSLPDIYEWFINAGFKNISVEKLDRCCSFTSDISGEIKIDAFIACGEK